MKVAFVVNNYPPRAGGVELHVQSLAQELTRLGHSALVVTLGSPPSKRVSDGIEVITLSERWRIADTLGFPPFGTRSALTRLLEVRGVDVVSVHTRFFPMSYIGLRAAHRAGLPVIHTEHGSEHVASNSMLIRNASRAVDFTLGRYVLRRADHVLGVSEDVVAFVRRLAGVNADVFYNAIPIDEEPRQYQMRPDHLVFVGRLVPGKGWEDYVQVIAQLRRDGHEVTGSVLGSGPDEKRLRDHLRNAGLGEVVQVRGRVSPREVRAALEGAVLVNPTRLSEGFQTTLLEALAEGGQVVTYRVPGAQLLAEQGAPVSIANEATPTALAKLAENCMKETRSPGRPAFILEWSWRKRVEQFVEVCRKVTRSRSSVDPD